MTPSTPSVQAKRNSSQEASELGKKRVKYRGREGPDALREREGQNTPILVKNNRKA